MITKTKLKKERRPSEYDEEREFLMNKFRKVVLKVIMINRIKNNVAKPPDETELPDKYEPKEFTHRLLIGNLNLQEGTGNKSKEYKHLEDIRDSVDFDDEDLQEHIASKLVGSIVESKAFRVLIFIVIITNAFVVGLQTIDTVRMKHRYAFEIANEVFLGLFLIEMVLKWYYCFRVYWKIYLNVLDCFIIVALILGPRIMFPHSDSILRMLRVLRALRSLKSIGALSGLSTIVSAITSSLPDMLNIVILLCIILLVFAVSGVSFFSKTMPSRFAQLNNSFFTLFICVTQDGWVEIYEEFKNQELYITIFGSMYLFIVILLGAFVFANIVVAVVVTNLEIAIKYKKQKLNKRKNTSYLNGELDEEIDISRYDVHRHTFSPDKQAPFEISTIPNLNTLQISKYLMIIYALEENLREYKDLRSDLNQIYDVVNHLNMDDSDRRRSMNTELQRNQVVKNDKGEVIVTLLKPDGKDKDTRSKRSNKHKSSTRSAKIIMKLKPKEVNEPQKRLSKRPASSSNRGGDNVISGTKAKRSQQTRMKFKNTVPSPKHVMNHKNKKSRIPKLHFPDESDPNLNGRRKSRHRDA